MVQSRLYPEWFTLLAVSNKYMSISFNIHNFSFLINAFCMPSCQCSNRVQTLHNYIFSNYIFHYFICSHINWQKLWPDNFLGTWWVIFVPANLILINYSHRPSLSQEWVCRKVIVKHSIYQKLFNVWTDFNLHNFTFAEYFTWIRANNNLIRLPRDY